MRQKLDAVEQHKVQGRCTLGRLNGGAEVAVLAVRSEPVTREGVGIGDHVRRAVQRHGAPDAERARRRHRRVAAGRVGHLCLVPLQQRALRATLLASSPSVY